MGSLIREPMLKTLSNGALKIISQLTYLFKKHLSSKKRDPFTVVEHKKIQMGPG